ncbi:hypothetical protein PAXINDRAFT_158031 [Paxillus involutus ATCC 200175]|uniref:Unplaced genomic scaffold PAXINscaffold_218, whole genome shotgun sequence n=1 Tax=Paxillus involutus ATCC 200175 TaxID=664439 RepID=A0A0C9TCY2_PAXIN|nr:hypothetical protein PAXINDRAFT_158031 [Paxillus involutus ATCC 200175]
MCAVLDSKYIVVRDEYRQAMLALEERVEYSRGASILGQPGIGKSLFLIYALVERLQKRQPTAYQYHDDRYFLFTETGVTSQPANHDLPLDTSHGGTHIWALSDSNARTIQPASAFITLGVRTVQAASPNRQRWKEWTKQAKAGLYVMDVWQQEELAALATILECDTDHILHLAAQWGSSPRTLLNLSYSKQNEEAFQITINTSASAFVMEADTTLAGLRSFNIPIEKLDTSSILFIGPQRDKYGIVSRTRATMEKDALICSQFFAAMGSHASMRCVAGYIFEQWVHACLLSGHKLNCTWLNNDSVPHNPVATQPNRLISTEDELKSCKPPFYWCPVASSFPGIDGLLHCEDDVYAIQITISHKKSPEDSLHILQKNMRGGHELHWRVLFIGMDMEQAEEVAKPWMRLQEDLKRKRGEQEMEYIPVGICALPLNSNFNREMVVNALQRMAKDVDEGKTSDNEGDPNNSDHDINTPEGHSG